VASVVGRKVAVVVVVVVEIVGITVQLLCSWLIYTSLPKAE